MFLVGSSMQPTRKGGRDMTKENLTIMTGQPRKYSYQRQLAKLEAAKLLVETAYNHVTDALIYERAKGDDSMGEYSALEDVMHQLSYRLHDMIEAVRPMVEMQKRSET
jgi:hypothetical protein